MWNRNIRGYAKFADKVSMDIMEQYLEVAADFCQNELLPINATGDQQGCRLNRWHRNDTGMVLKLLMTSMWELGFTSLTGDEQYGGQGFPTLYRIAISEIITATNWSWGMYPGLSMVPCVPWNIMVAMNRNRNSWCL